MVKENAKGAKDIVVGNAATLNFYRKMITGTVNLRIYDHDNSALFSAILK